MAMNDLCDFPRLLARHGVRLTRLRLAVLEILGAAPRALRAPEILETLRLSRSVNKVTVYRILEDCTSRGILRRLAVDERGALYELACEHNPPHPHFQCRTCREVQCLEPVPLERMWSEIQGPLGNRVDHIDIRVAGVCRKCRDL
jgi:Fur family ferric uptake transcriptional regulator